MKRVINIFWLGESQNFFFPFLSFAARIFICKNIRLHTLTHLPFFFYLFSLAVFVDFFFRAEIHYFHCAVDGVLDGYLIYSLIDEDELLVFDTCFMNCFLYTRFASINLFSLSVSLSSHHIFDLNLLDIMLKCLYLRVYVLVFDVDDNVCRQLTISLKIENSNNNTRMRKHERFFCSKKSAKKHKYKNKYYNKIEQEKEQEKEELTSKKCFAFIQNMHYIFE